jgi:hypothetical protein
MNEEFTHSPTNKPRQILSIQEYNKQIYKLEKEIEAQSIIQQISINLEPPKVVRQKAFCRTN